MSATSNQLKEYLMISPDGAHFVVTKEVFEGFSHFLFGEKPSGRLIIEFKRGGIAEVEQITRKLYKQEQQ